MTASTYGRQVVEALTNKSGGSVAAGDVVIIDTTNNDAFTTTTSASFTGVVGIAQETIANNATGRVLMSGYAALVNVQASVTRGHYGFTYTVAKQATGSASRAAGAFGQFLTGGTTPDAHIFGITDSSVTGLTDPMTTRGDVIVRNASNVTARLAIGSSGKVLQSDGTDISWQTPSAGAFTHAYVGYNTVGGSFENITGTFLKTITLAAAGVLVAIEAHVKGNSSALAMFWPVILDDTGAAGAPGKIIGGAIPDNAADPQSSHLKLNGTARWIALPLSKYLAAGTYYIGVSASGAGSAGSQIAYDGSGSDYENGGTGTTGDGGIVTYTAGSHKHSIRGSIIS